MEILNFHPWVKYQNLFALGHMFLDLREIGFDILCELSAYRLFTGDKFQDLFDFIHNQQNLKMFLANLVDTLRDNCMKHSVN